jgi:DNA-binding NarL/FixJ family response regulator
MRTMRAKVEGAGTPTTVASALQGELGIDRLSIARFGPGYFEIVAAAGKALFIPGQRLPTAVSTQLARSATGRVYAASSFMADFDPPRPVDELMLALGFRSGCSIPIGPVGRPVGAVSLSSTIDGLCYDRVLRAVAEVEAPLSQLLADGSAARGVAVVWHDDELVAAGFARLLQDRFALVTRVVGSADEAVAMVRGEAVRLILCDSRMRGIPADRFVQMMRSAGTAAPVVMVPSTDTSMARRVAARAGAVAYMPRHLGASRILAAVSAAWQGWTTLPDFTDEPRVPPLTRRESDVLLGLDEGLTFRGIGRRHGITESTAKSYGRSLFRKLDAHSRGEAVAKARRIGILSG